MCNWGGLMEDMSSNWCWRYEGPCHELSNHFTSSRHSRSVFLKLSSFHFFIQRLQCVQSHKLIMSGADCQNCTCEVKVKLPRPHCAITPNNRASANIMNTSDQSSASVWHAKSGGRYPQPKQASTINSDFAASEFIYRNPGSSPPRCKRREEKRPDECSSCLNKWAH